MCLTLFLVVASNGFRAKTAAQEPDVQAGNELFNRVWRHDDFEDPFLVGTQNVEPEHNVGDGLGPLHNATSCAACHKDGGASGVDGNVTMLTLDPRSPLFSTDHNTGQGRRDLLEMFPTVFSPNGQVALDSLVHNYSVRQGFDVVRNNLSHGVKGGIPNAWYQPKERTSEAIAETPVVAGRYQSVDYYLSQRSSPPLFGLGIIDKISTKTLEQMETRQRKDSRGRVSGRRGIGKFGWRAQSTSLASFVRGACTGELGLSQKRVTQAMDPVDWDYRNNGIDISELECKQLTDFVASLPAPQEKRASRTLKVREGKKLFYRQGCADCHVEDLDPAVGLYSDLLLHDMGSRLQAPSPAPVPRGTDKVAFFRVKRFVPPGAAVFGRSSVAGYYGTPSGQYPMPLEFASYVRKPVPKFPAVEIPLKDDLPEKKAMMTWDALQREWRTPPLWGVAHSGPYLHDGRATTIDEAIRWHGGEAKPSIEKYERMTERNRDKLLAFLNSLTAPVAPAVP